MIVCSAFLISNNLIQLLNIIILINFIAEFPVFIKNIINQIHLPVQNE